MITTQTVRPDTPGVSELAAEAVKTAANASYDRTTSLAKDLEILSSTCNKDTLNRIIDDLAKDMKLRLADVNNPAMLPTCVTRLPGGTELGSYLSVDLGGSTCRVAFLQLYGAKHTVKDPNHVPYKVLYKVSHPVDRETKCLSGEGFFKWIGNKIKDAIDYAITQGFIQQDYEELVMGLSWSFPFKQDSVERGYLAQMGKGYEVSDDIQGWDLKKSFEAMGKELGIRVKVTAVVNDTLASLISHAYDSYTTKMSLILGTGLNACALLPLKQMNGKVAGLNLGNTDSCLVNMELSLLSMGIVPDTKWDLEVDANVEKPGYQPLEEKVSGRYLGEMSRMALRDLIKNKELLNGVMPQGFDQPYALESATICDVEVCYYKNDMAQAQQVLFGAHPVATKVSDKDMQTIASIIIAVSTRAAALTAAALVAAAAMCPEDMTHCTIAYEGTVIEKYPKMRSRVQDYLDLLGKPRNRTLDLQPVGDGSLLGPAIASAMFKHIA